MPMLSTIVCIFHMCWVAGAPHMPTTLAAGPMTSAGCTDKPARCIRARATTSALSGAAMQAAAAPRRHLPPESMNLLEQSPESRPWAHSVRCILAAQPFHLCGRSTQPAQAAPGRSAPQATSVTRSTRLNSAEQQGQPDAPSHMAQQAVLPIMP